jgi:hypothetical protein
MASICGFAALNGVLVSRRGGFASLLRHRLAGDEFPTKHRIHPYPAPKKA